MKTPTAVLALALLAPVMACSTEQKTQAPEAKPAGTQEQPAATAAGAEDAKTFYAIGLMLGGNLKPLGLSAAELESVKQGMADAATGAKPQVELQAYAQKVQQLAQTRMQATALAEKEKAKAFADTAAQEPGAVRTPSGLVYRSLAPGSGAAPTTASVVKVHYEGTLTDGTVFDSSIKRGQPAEFPLQGVIPCWTEALQKMKVGEKARIVCPSEIAYGDRGQPPTIPGGATLVFQVELLEVKAAPPGIPGHPPVGKPQEK